ncbi:MAG: hypothetical protein EOM67_15235, partial [Spirochaetia bacterium]|nr:hypothetical protein [Spirochaetia bacterium]
MKVEEFLQSNGRSIEKVSPFVQTMDTLLSKAQDIQRKCSDTLIPEVSIDNIRFSDLGNLTYQANGRLHDRTLTSHALSQLCNKIGIPTRYIEKCLNEGYTDLAAENINQWLSNFGKSLLIREYDHN